MHFGSPTTPVVRTAGPGEGFRDGFWEGSGYGFWEGEIAVLVGELGATVAAVISDLVRLRPVREDDLPLLEGFLTDPDVCGELQWQGWKDPHTFRRRFADDGMLGADKGLLMVVSASGDEPLGFVGWREVVIFRTASHWNIGIQLLPDARGRGVGTAAQRLLVRYLFAHTPVVRIEADTDAENIAEQRCLEKAGFTGEGVSRSVVFRDGQWRDGVRYAVLRGDAGWAQDAEDAEDSRSRPTGAAAVTGAAAAATAPAPAPAPAPGSSVTFINVFEIAPEDVAAFAEKWEQRATIMSKKPGFIDTRLHRAQSSDGRFQLVNVAHWESEAAWEAAGADPEFANRANAARDSVKTPVTANPGLYDVVVRFP